MSSNLVSKELVKDLLHTKVFYYHTIRGWEVGTILNLSVIENRAGVAQVILSIRSLDDDQLSDLVYKPSLLMKCSSGSDVLCPDNLLTLPELHNGVLVNALKLRHRKDIMYTNLGELVVAINPFKYSIPHYQDSCMKQYLECLHHAELPPTLLPHPWAVAHRAYASMMSMGTNHSIIISGESGSGKTESCKTMIKYLCQVSETLSARQRRQNEALHPPNPHVKPATTPTTTTSTPISGSSASAAAKAEEHSMASMSGIIDRVQLSNLILEAFGNAKTLRNDNSSRFGKLTEVQFSQSGQLVGMRTTPFLLERSRVVHCALEERVFHCFYQLASGGSKELLAELRIRSARDFQLLGQGKCISLKASGVDDAVDFKKVNHALTGLKFSDAERHTVWRVVAAVAHLQNVQFIDHASQFGKKSSEEAELDPGSVDTVTFVAKDLLRLPDPNSLLQALVESTSVVKGQGTIVRKLSTQKALDQRDSISKLLYSKLFLWLVDRINAATEYRHASTFEEDDAEEQTSDMSPKTWIALLDIFGFEDFPVNSFEQFCINLANESLQRHYTHHHFIRDMEDMKREGITTQRVSFVDNGPCVELLQGQKNSVISVLDDCSTLDLERGANNNPNTAFLGKLTQLHRPEYQTSGPKSGGKSVLDRNGSGVSEHGDQGPAMEKPQDYFFRGRLDDDSFTIRHYACDVKYKVDGFVEKNMDHVRESSLTTLKTTTDEVLQSVFDVDENIGLLQDLQTAPASPRGGAGSPSRGGAGSSAGGPAGGRRSTVASQFRASLKLLMDTLDQSHPHWVRCIRPHVRKAPDLFDGKLVLEQLVATGILATIEQRQRNFPYRIPHGEFLQRFGVLAASSLRRLSSRSSNQERCNAIISALRIQSSSASSDPSSPSPSPNRHVNAIGDDANIQAGHTKMFLSSTVMLQLEKQREVLLDQHVMCVSAFVRTFTARKVMVKIIWTLHAIRMQRAARRTLRIRRCVNAYYAELRQRIVDRHLQEQRDLIQVESRARPRVLAEEQAEFFDTAKHFRALLGPMITTVLKNVRAVEATTRHELGEHLQQAYWKLEAFFAEGVAKAHELRSQRLKEERERRQHMMEVFWTQNVEGRSRIVEIEAKERHAMMTNHILPEVRLIHVAAARIQQQQRERDIELQRLHVLRNEELRRLRRAEERRIEGERGLWRSAIGEASYLTDLAHWKYAPAGAYEEFMHQFCSAKLPSRMLPGGADARLHHHGDATSASSVSDVAKALFDRYRGDLLMRADGDASVFQDPQGLRRVVVGDEHVASHSTANSSTRGRGASPLLHHQRSYARVALASPTSPELQRRAADTVKAHYSLPGRRPHTTSSSHLSTDTPAAGHATMESPSSRRRYARGGRSTGSSDDELELLKELDREKRLKAATGNATARHGTTSASGGGRRELDLHENFESSSDSDRAVKRTRNQRGATHDRFPKRSGARSPPTASLGSFIEEDRDATTAGTATKLESSTQLMRHASILKLFAAPIRHAATNPHAVAQPQDQQASVRCGGFDRALFSPSGKVPLK